MPVKANPVQSIPASAGSSASVSVSANPSQPNPSQPQSSQIKLNHFSLTITHNFSEKQNQSLIIYQQNVIISRHLISAIDQFHQITTLFVAIRINWNQIKFNPHGVGYFSGSSRLFLIVVAKPSNSGKLTLINRLVTRKCDGESISVANGPNSCTTDFQWIVPMKTCNFCHILNLHECESANLFFIDSEELFNQQG
jgi:hypothetical protein